MPGFITRFETAEPIKFKENGYDTEFEAHIEGALYVNELEEGAYGATQKEQAENLNSMAIEKLKHHLSGWHEGGKVLCVDGEEELSLCLIMDLQDKGIDGSARIKTIRISDDALYQEQVVKPMIEGRRERRRKELELADEPHGPLVSISYDRCSHGMMAGSSSSDSQTVEWKSDGTIIYGNYSSGGGKSFNSEYVIPDEVARKFIDFVAVEKLAAVSKLDIPKPVMYDCFTSATITMDFDDSSIGGAHREMCTIQCGPAGMVFKRIEDKLMELFEECRKSGECIKNEMHETSNGLSGLMGIGSMGMDGSGMMNMGPGMAFSGLRVPGSKAENVNQGNVAHGKWTCLCGTDNTGKFCVECGRPRPSEWSCICGQKNNGKFCTECGKPRPSE